jgi:hypothetical protein
MATALKERIDEVQTCNVQTGNVQTGELTALLRHVAPSPGVS